MRAYATDAKINKMLIRHALRRATPIIKTATRGMPLVPMVIESSGVGGRVRVGASGGGPHGSGMRGRGTLSASESSR